MESYIDPKFTEVANILKSIARSEECCFFTVMAAIYAEFKGEKPDMDELAVLAAQFIDQDVFDSILALEDFGNQLPLSDDLIERMIEFFAVSSCNALRVTCIFVQALKHNETSDRLVKFKGMDDRYALVRSATFGLHFAELSDLVIVHRRGVQGLIFGDASGHWIVHHRSDITMP
jgi:hypothetical protein